MDLRRRTPQKHFLDDQSPFHRGIADIRGHHQGTSAPHEQVRSIAP
jgi:hypothetical protein